MAMTAKELMEILEKDTKYQEALKTQDKKFEILTKMYDEDQKELLEELRQAGFELKSVWDFLVWDNADYMDAVPILQKHLSMKHHPKTISGIARSLAMPELYDNQELWDILVKLYRQVPSDDDINVPEERGRKQAIGLAIEALATEERIPTIEALIESNKESIDEIGFLEDSISALNANKHPSQKLRRGEKLRKNRKRRYDFLD